MKFGSSTRFLSHPRFLPRENWHLSDRQNFPRGLVKQKTVLSREVSAEERVTMQIDLDANESVQEEMKRRKRDELRCLYSTLV